MRLRVSRGQSSVQATYQGLWWSDVVVDGDCVTTLQQCLHYRLPVEAAAADDKGTDWHTISSVFADDGRRQRPDLLV